MLLKELKIFRNIFFLSIIFLLVYSKFNANEYIFKKITNLNSPWLMSFINEKELILSKQAGKLMLVY